jgi:hypothetical protein
MIPFKALCMWSIQVLRRRVQLLVPSRVISPLLFLAKVLAHRRVVNTGSPPVKATMPWNFHFVLSYIGICVTGNDCLLAVVRELCTFPLEK